jgi:hypothetical protein
MFTPTRTTCIICGSPQPQILFNLAESGVPHSTPGHRFAYSYKVISVCNKCGHGQLEAYSHDCFKHYTDEPWEMFWMYAFTPTEVLRLSAKIKNCPDPQNPQCQCQIHQQLRISSERLWSVPHVESPHGKITFAWICLDESKPQLQLRLDSRKGHGQAV